LENQVVSKKDDNTLTVIKSVPVQFEFTPEYLKQQIVSIMDQKERDNAQRDLEIAECEAYLAKCLELNVTDKITSEVATIEEKQ
jgi:hypothetical protein